MDKRVVFGVATVVVLVGLLAVGWMTSPDGSANIAMDAPIDDRFSVSQIAQGDLVAGVVRTTFEDGIPIALIEHDGELYLFASGTPDSHGDTSGLLAWRSADGVSWAPLGQVIGDDFLVAAVTSTPGSLVAVGREPGSSRLIVWRSDDASSWLPTESPRLTGEAYLIPEPVAVAAIGDRVAVANQLRVDAERLLEDHLWDAGIEMDLSTVSWDTRDAGDDGTVLRVYGPLGTPALNTTLGELGLTEGERSWVTSGYDGNTGTGVWVSGGDAGSDVASIGASELHSLVATPEGSFLAVGADSRHMSANGSDWSRVETRAGPVAIEHWSEGLAGITDDSPVEVLLSRDGITWEPSGVAELFPAALDWNATAFGAGPEGIAMAVDSRDGALIRQIEPTTLVFDEETRLTLDFARGTIALEAGETTYTWEWNRGDSIENPEGIVTDLRNETVLFTDPANGDVLATFTFAELSRAKNRYNTDRFEPTGHQALVFSKDGEGWAIQDIAGEVGDDHRMELLEVAAGRLVAAVRHGREPFTPYPVPGFTIWSAEVP